METIILIKQKCIYKITRQHNNEILTIKDDELLQNRRWKKQKFFTQVISSSKPNVRTKDDETLKGKLNGQGRTIAEIPKYRGSRQIFNQ